MKFPLVSVLIPIHNGEMFLEECLDSVVSQDYPNYEVVVINDASTDNTGEILRSYKGIRVIDIEKETALSNVLNRGLELCEGEYVARMDADDVMKPGRLSKQVAFLEENPEVGIVGGTVEVINMDSKKIGVWKYSDNSTRAKNSLWYTSAFAHPAVMYRKDVVLQVGGYPKDTPTVEDIMLWFKLSQVTEFSNLKDEVLQYRKTDGSESLGDLDRTFRRTIVARNWAKDELGITPPPLYYFLWKMEELFVWLFPINFLASVVEFVQKIF